MKFLRRPAALALITLTAACAINPVTGQRELALISERQEIEMGREYSAQVEQQVGLVDDAALQSYAEEIGLGLARSSERPHLPWRFRVLDDPTPNAFALPGGFIYVTRGLVDLMGSEAQLASVLGHEIGHVTARHSVSQMSRAQLAQLGLGVGMILLPDLQQYGQIAGAGLGILFLKYGRDDERQADELGFQYALDADYDVREMGRVFASLEGAARLAGASGLPDWLSSHPAPPERIENVQRRVTALDRPLDRLRVGREPYLDRIDGLVYGANPRNGFFQDEEFIHPDMRFRVTFPAGWAAQNSARAVAAGSPRNDAAAQLTLADGLSVDAAVRDFAAQSGAIVLERFEGAINGLDARGVEFAATSDGTELRGMATFIGHEGHVIRLLGYAAAPAYDAYRATFLGWTRSFRVLTEQPLLDVQPDRVRIVSLPRAMSLAAFASAYPSTIPLEELALINQVEDPAAQRPQGTLTKRVAR